MSVKIGRFAVCFALFLAGCSGLVAVSAYAFSAIGLVPRQDAALMAGAAWEFLRMTVPYLGIFAVVAFLVAWAVGGETADGNVR